MSVTAKGRGKSGGARVITCNVFAAGQTGRIYLLLIYDKADASGVRTDVVKRIARDLGLR